MTWLHRYTPNKYMFISEAGPLDVRHSVAAEQIARWFRILEDEFPYVLGGAPFMWNWGQEHPELNYYDKPAIKNSMRTAPKKEFPLPANWIYEEGEMLPDWMIDLRGEAGEHTGLALEQPIGILVHHAGSYAPFAKQLEYIKEHPCYHFAIDGDQVHYMRDISEVVWHAGDGAEGPWNKGGIAPCFLGCYMGTKPSDAMFASLRKLYKWLMTQGIPDVIKGHKDVRLTACPGDWYPGDEHPDYRNLLLGLADPTEALRKQIKEMKQDIQALAHKWV